MKLKKICKFEGSVELLTGLAIKGADTELRIGGVDSEVIKNPLTGDPYIPGSSLKGKMRSSLERLYGAKNRFEKPEEEKPCGCGRRGCPVCLLFGAHMNTRAESAPTRIIVRDCSLTDESRAQIRAIPIEQGTYLETKAENIIKRKSGTADSPRMMERVPAGLSFTLEIVLQVFERDDETKMKENIQKALDLVRDTYLGGSGSRGYGQVAFHGEWNDKEIV